MRKQNRNFAPAHTICCEALAGKVKPRDFIICVPFYGVPENRNARSGVRFLGKRSNKCTRAWRQTKRAACPPSPCCDERKEGENAAENAKAFERRCRPPITEKSFISLKLFS